MKYYVGIDLGGTNIAVGVVDENYQIISRSKMKTNAIRPAEPICDDMAAAVHMALKNASLTLKDVYWVGVGTPGTVDHTTGVIGYANNLDFHNVPIKKMMEERLGVKVYVENDANAAAYGEAVAGAAKGVQNMLAITLGTGVGGGIILDGKIYSGTHGAGGELGHMGIVMGGRHCTCGRNGCIEAYASATGLINLTKEAMQEHKDSKMWQFAESLEQVSGRTAFDAMREGDAYGEAVVDTYVEYLAYGLVNYINIFAPELIVIGGGISKEGEPFLKRIREKISAQIYGDSTVTRLACAQLGNDAGIIGAAFLGNLADNL
ncbi:ROK family protein [Hydrogenoanaerobacterium sp.]|uniref:ROK family protein n=1 Tax=Hydrogenoanaerobacterium sp. TaxID=2953763 RepID=UPI0028A221CF|nr:ROK family protein [Hydrogenoanaerobacterium sp.]